MRPPTLQYLYLQKPITMVVLLCMVSILPWISMGEFSTKGEPREAAVAISMLETGNWILPTVYADEIAYKPPMVHWLMAVASLPQGYVSEFTSRLPSAIAYITLMGVVLFFFGERIKFQEAFIATLLLATCIEIHRAGMTARVDMVLTAFIVIGLFQLYRWENKLELKGLPIQIPILLGCAVLTKGPVGVVLPLFVFGVYLLILNKHSFLVIFKSIFYIGVSSLFLPMLWYVAAWRQGGDGFLNIVLAENFGRFFHFENAQLNYDLGHYAGAWYNFVTLFAGFMPWTVFFVFSLFGMKIKRPDKSFKELIKNAFDRLRSMEKVKLFSLVALVCIIFFYCIPSSKRSVYLMPAYPFIALFLAQYAIYLTEYRTRVTRVFAGFLAVIVSFVILFLCTGILNIVEIGSRFTSKASKLQSLELVQKSLTEVNPVYAIVFLTVMLALFVLIYQMIHKINIKILYATIFLVFSINLMIDGIVMREIRNSNSSRKFAERIIKEYPVLKTTGMYVGNNLREYTNLYGLNFYLGNQFQNFETTNPDEGFLIATERDLQKLIEKHQDTYQIKLLTTSGYVISDLKQQATLSHFIKK